MRPTPHENGLQHELSLRLRAEGIPVLDQTHGGLIAVTSNGKRQKHADRIAANLGHVASAWRPGETRYFPLRTDRNRWENQADQWNLRRWHWMPVALHLEAEVDPCHDARIKSGNVMVWNTTQNPDTAEPTWQSECEDESDAEAKIREFLLSEQGQRSRRDVIRQAAKTGWPNVRPDLIDAGYTVTAQEKLELEKLDLEPGDWLGTSGRASQREAEVILTKEGFVSVSLQREMGMIVWVPDSPRQGTRDRNRRARTLLMAALKEC